MNDYIAFDVYLSTGQVELLNLGSVSGGVSLPSFQSVAQLVGAVE